MAPLYQPPLWKSDVPLVFNTHLSAASCDVVGASSLVSRSLLHAYFAGSPAAAGRRRAKKHGACDRDQQSPSAARSRRSDGGFAPSSGALLLSADSRSPSPGIARSPRETRG